MKSLLECFQGSGLRSYKWNHYFDIYESSLGKYRESKVKVVEVGVLHGGSLEMWARYFGVNSEIIGIDVKHPKVDPKYWIDLHSKENSGKVLLEIGNAEDSQYWDDFWKRNPDVDVFIDDGGHSNLQQILAIEKAINHVKPGGVIICEDTATSFDKSFGNPHRYSFSNYAHHVADQMTIRLKMLSSLTDYAGVGDLIQSVEVHPGITIFRKYSDIESDYEVFNNNGTSSLEAGSAAPSLQLPFISAESISLLSAWLQRRKTTVFLSRIAMVVLGIYRKIGNQKLRPFFKSKM